MFAIKEYNSIPSFKRNWYFTFNIMAISFFITKRFLQNKQKEGSFSFFSSISILGIALGVATLIITLSVLNGFEEVVSEKILNLDSHIQITSFGNSKIANYHRTKIFVENSFRDNLKSIEPFCAQIGIVAKSGLQEGTTIRGVSNTFFQNKNSMKLISGKFELDSQRYNIIIGKTLADKLRLAVGDRVNIFSVGSGSGNFDPNSIVVESFTVSGVYESGWAKFDDAFAFINFEQSQNIFGFGNSVSGFELRLNNIEAIKTASEYLQEKLPYPHYVRSAFEMNRNFFNWIELQKKPIPIVLTLIILVAVFNIISTLLVSVLEKSHSIGILKSIGAKNSTIGTIFLNKGFYVGILGVIFGNILAAGLIFSQMQFNIISLPSHIYFTSTVPLQPTIEIFSIVSAASLLLSIIISWIPAFIASRVNPISVLRFN